MGDLAKQLRKRELRVMSDAYEAIYDAADRIEALEAALREIMEVSDQKSYGFAFDSHAVYFRMARAALAGEKP